MQEPVTSAACGVVVDYVIGQVERKEYNAGDRLPPERVLAQQLKVNRTTVREAIKVLNYLGFVDSNHGSGNYVTNTYDKTFGKIMKIMYLRDIVDFDGFTVFRQMLELQSFELAIKNATEAQKAEMRQIVDLLDITADSGLRISLDNRFHTLLVEASQNALITINFQALSNVITEYMSKVFLETVSKKTAGFERLQEFHHAIADALTDGDREKGIQAIKDHFSWLY
ncbi:MAG: FCD domain-containing protein [Oscillospiraceae bacterium]|jgi:GntR family transcriptional repressor for pyruvate dehydrogenase complex|nr:FCD domain-containing protein [Oscillospiraceae bacterium]